MIPVGPDTIFRKVKRLVSKFSLPHGFQMIPQERV